MQPLMSCSTRWLMTNHKIKTPLENFGRKRRSQVKVRATAPRRNALLGFYIYTSQTAQCVTHRNTAQNRGVTLRIFGIIPCSADDVTRAASWKEERRAQNFLRKVPAQRREIILRCIGYYVSFSLSRRILDRFNAHTLTQAQRFSRRITHHNLPGAGEGRSPLCAATDCDAQGKRDYVLAAFVFAPHLLTSERARALFT